MAFSQSDSTLLLHEIEITAQRIVLTDIGKHTDVLDSQTLALGQYNNLSAQIAMKTPLFVRSYGNGTLATLGIRGGSAAHTQLLWNGIPLRNPMIGLVDLALIPSVFIDEAQVHYGGHGAAFGSGAVGGLISLSNETISPVNNVNVRFALGSWGTRVGEFTTNYGGNKLRLSTRLFSHYAENNYRYRLNEDLPEKNQVHHQLEHYGLLQEIAWSVNEHQQLSARVWYDVSDREIPPTSTQTTSKSSQQDENLRMTLQWNNHGEKFNWQIKTAFLDEAIDYQDSLIRLYTHNQFRTWITEVESSITLSPLINLTGGLYSEDVHANSANYDQGTSRNQYSAFTSIRYVNRDWVWRFQVREEVTDGDWSPLLIDLSTEWSVLRQMTVKYSLSRNYRTPTLNELFWRPGGNPDLVPEQGWTFESGLHYATSGKYPFVTSSLTGYTRTIEQWIMWMPPIKDVRNYWSPINISEVHSSGLEARGDIKVVENTWTFSANAGIDLTWSTFGDDLPEFMIMEGDQLFYVPVENILAGIRITHPHWTGYYFHHWYGSSTGINESVDAGNIGSAGASYIFDSSQITGTLYLQADNIWNVPYRIIERRPMPGRSFTVGVKFTFF
jgi:iron complex outermembrane receptor protein